MLETCVHGHCAQNLRTLAGAFEMIDGNARTAITDIQSRVIERLIKRKSRNGNAQYYACART